MTQVQTDWFAQNAPPPQAASGGDWFAENAPGGGKQASAQPGFLDKEIPLDSYTNATLSGVQSIGRAARGMAESIPNLIKHPLDALSSITELPGQAAQVPAAIHDINQSDDPTGTYAKVGQETAAQGAVQALTAAATEGVLKGGAMAARPVLRVVGESVDPDLVGLVSPRAAHAVRVAQKIGKVVNKAGKEAEVEASGAEVYRDATLNKRNIPEYAGEGDEAPALETAPGDQIKSRLDELVEPEANLIKDRLSELNNPSDAALIKSRLADLQQPVHDIIDSAVPPEGPMRGTNLLTKARIDHHLAQGDVEGAQAVLEQAKGPSTDVPRGTFPAEGGKRIVPSVQNIRENDTLIRDAESQPGPKATDRLDDRALSQEMNWNLEREGWNVESEARREFIARNSTGMTKAELNKRFDQAIGKVKPDAAGPVPTPADADLKALLEKSLEMARKAKR